MAQKELLSSEGLILCDESYADEYSAPCCVITEHAFQAIRDELFSFEKIIEFADDISALASEGMEPESCYVISLPGRWPELYTEEALRRSILKLTS